jgi:hypothetical protein
MSFFKKKFVPPLPPAEPSPRAPVMEPPKLPEAEHAFFGILLRELYGGVQEAEKLAKKPEPALLSQKLLRLRSSLSYALALLRLDELRAMPTQPEPASMPTLLNIAVNNLRREFLYAGVAPRRASEEPQLNIAAPQAFMLFLLEEMLGCCLRCVEPSASLGKNLYIGLKQIDRTLLLSLRTEGPPLLQAPLIPILTQEEPADGSPPQEYGFALCAVLADHLGWPFRWEADEAGVRMFLDIGV